MRTHLQRLYGERHWGSSRPSRKLLINVQSLSYRCDTYKNDAIIFDSFRIFEWKDKKSLSRNLCC